jgi:CHAT domain-containing protein/tetratricopeptide (TPR) repeat protein
MSSGLAAAASAFLMWTIVPPLDRAPLDDGRGAGVVVEHIAPGFAGARAALQEGDVVRQWSRGDALGPVDSPFDLSWLEMEQAPRGRVTLHGWRGLEPRTWELGEGQWGLRARPPLSPTALRGYREALDNTENGNAVRWRAAVAQADAAWRPWVLARAAEATGTAGGWDQAQEFYGEAVRLAAAASPARVSTLRLTWAAAAFARGDLDAAEAQYRQVAEPTADPAETLAQARAIAGLGSVAWNRGDLAAAESNHQRALVLAERLAPGSLEVAANHVGLGHVMAERAELDRAESHFSRALAIQEERAPRSLEVARTLGGLGHVAFDRGDLAAAEANYGRALAIRESLVPEGREVALSLASLGNVAEGRGDLARAEEHYRRALGILQRLAPDSVNVGILSNNLGVVAERRGDFEAAQAHYFRALAIDEKLAPESLLVAGVLHNLGSVTHARLAYDEAEAYYRRCLRIQDKLAPTSLQQAGTLNSLGRLYAERGRLDEAEDHHRRALAMAEAIAPEGRVAAESLPQLGQLALRRGDLAAAESHFQRALAVWEQRAPGSVDHAETLAELAGILRRRGQPAAAEEAYARALHALENQTSRLGGAASVRSSFRARHAAKYRDYASLLVERGQPDRAFQVLERSRARTLLEMLAAGGVNVRRGAPPELLQRQHALQDLLEAKADRRLRLLDGEGSAAARQDLERELDDLLVRYHEVQGELRARSPAYAALTQPEPLDLREVQALLGADTLLLQYALGDESSRLFVVGSDTVASAELPGRAEIEGLARRLHEGLRARGLRPAGEGQAARRARVDEADAAVTAALRELGPLLLPPAAHALEKKRLLVVADGILHYVPFAALPDPGARREPDAQAPPLIAAHEVLHLPSASVLAVLRRQAAARTTPRKGVAVLADPVFDASDARVRSRPASAPPAPPASSASLSRSLAEVGLVAEGPFRRLPFTRQEALAIRAATRPQVVLHALDFQASRSRAMDPALADYRIVHLATHGILNGHHPELSGLVLSLVDEQGRPRNGFLGLEDVYNLNLPVDLVVLSACASGLGPEVTGEGLIGLTRGFMHAGATRVVASLWNVDDWATAELMARFYQEMARSGLPPSAALRRAQLELRRNRRWASPYYWAAFAIHGDWK